MLIAGSTLLSLVYANRKAQALQSVINNLNVSLDGMVRNIREGSNYRCGGEASNYGDCTTGNALIYFTPFGSPSDDQPKDDWAYVFDTNDHYCGTDRICENEHGDGWVPITSTEVTIQNLVFYVVGTKPASQGGTQQPKVIFTLKGEAGVQAAASSTFDIQATAVQRVLNL